MSFEKCRPDLPVRSNQRSNLAFVEEGGDACFSIRWVYCLYCGPGGASRAGHAHRKLQQLRIAVANGFAIELDDGSEKKSVQMNRSYCGRCLPPMLCREIHSFSSGRVCLVLASDYHEEADYSRDRSEFVVGAREPR